MKKVNVILFAFLVLFYMASCGGPSDKRAEILERMEAGEIPADVDVFILDTESSTVVWEGKRLGGGHDGTIGIKEGVFYVYDEELLAGNVFIDMEQIVVLDLQDPGLNARLKAHLESDDFFSVDTYPVAEFEITRAEVLDADHQGEYSHRVYGNMTIKGITYGIAFDATIDFAEERLTAFADFDLDRTRWDVRYGSGRFFDDLGDSAIYDDFNLKLDIVAAQ